MEHALERAFSDSTVDFDLIMDELLSGDYLLETPTYFDLFNQGTSGSNGPFGSLPFSPLLEFDNQEVDERSEKDGNFLIQTTCPIVPLKDRLFHALRFIKESQRDSDVLAQIWVPIRRGGRQILTTCGQPFWLDTNSQSLANYRAISVNYQFPAEENADEIVGLPGRVFLGKVPEWTPDVRYFRSDEYPRVDDAQRYNVCGTIALPIFERDGRLCIGVVEVVLTTQKINYSSDLENICNALEVCFRICSRLGVVACYTSTSLVEFHPYCISGSLLDFKITVFFMFVGVFTVLIFLLAHHHMKSLTRADSFLAS